MHQQGVLDLDFCFGKGFPRVDDRQTLTHMALSWRLIFLIVGVLILLEQNKDGWMGRDEDGIHGTINMITCFAYWISNPFFFNFRQDSTGLLSAYFSFASGFLGYLGLNGGQAFWGFAWNGNLDVRNLPCKVSFTHLLSLRKRDNVPNIPLPYIRSLHVLAAYEPTFILW
jgi:hypothetical protein